MGSAVFERRRFPRYKVTHFEALRGQLLGLGDHEKLMTFGMGGCGFYSFELNSGIELKQKVSCEFHFPEYSEDPISITGSVVYRHPIEDGGEVYYFYGIEFVPSQRSLVSPIVENLQQLVEQGELSTC